MSENDRTSASPQSTPAAAEPPQAVEGGGSEAVPANETAAEGGADSAQLQDPAVLLASLAAERDQLARERDEYYDLLLRRSAEFENYRKRVERERRELAEIAGMEAVRELLPILDDFERALKTATSDPEYARGIELIYQRFMEALKKLGLEPIASRGEKFDPYQHEAVETVPSEEFEDPTVIEEYRRGYNFRGRLLRPAMVKVAVKPDTDGRGQA
ncbi:MAG: nucleotide exchange factor GrpE [Bryobacterales bacterium]|nr:nucleotide exchange factor GrpE [Bryobacterales bacterium]